MDWRVKGAVQKILSRAPGGARLNDCLQRTLGGLRDPGQAVTAKVGDWVVFASHMRELGLPFHDVRYLEIGTGWFPTLPICFSLCGARLCHTFDLVRHLNDGLTFRMLGELRNHLPQLAEAARVPLSDIEASYSVLRESKTALQLLNRGQVLYHAPADATDTRLPGGSVDVIYSNSVLEHVPHEVIVRLMRESFRLLRPGGVVIHSLNCADRYAYFDPTISFINYLRYTENEWKRWNNTLQYQNRLRPRDFIEIAEREGLTVVLRKQKPRPDLLALLPSMQIAPEFDAYPPQELCCTSLDFAASKP